MINYPLKSPYAPLRFTEPPMFLSQLTIQTRLLIQTVLDQVAAWRPFGNSLGAKQRSLELAALEERVFLSASPMAVLAPETVESPTPIDANLTNQTQAAENLEIDPLLAALEVQTAAPTKYETQEESAQPRELVFIDAGVRDIEVLLADLGGAPTEGRSFEVIQLEAHRDGVEQISEILARRGNLEAVHIVSHGRDGAVKLGNTWLDSERLSEESGQISQWGLAFSAAGDLLFYGCDLTATGHGEQFVETLSELTGTDVAASSDATGHAQFGGDWELEFTTGMIESELAFSVSAQAEYADLLATLTVSTTNDTLDGDTSSISALLTNKGSDGLISLREAIIATNNTSGANVIFLSSGTYTLTRSGANENSALTGDLDISDDLTITGAGANTTFVDGSGSDRVFEVHSGTSTITHLKVQNGSASEGGGISTQSSASLILRDVALGGNQAVTNGGGIFARNNLTLDRVTIEGNTASSHGGGIYFLPPVGSLDLTNVTFSGNIASNRGAAIYSFGTVNLTNSTIAFNTASSGAGGIHLQGSADAILRNTILANNTGGNASRAVTSLGFNVVDDTSSISSPQTGDLVNTNPLLDTLKFNGGEIKTHKLLPGSSAIDAGTTTGAPGVDARNFFRDGSQDIGAYEVQSNLVTTGEFRVNTETNDLQELSARDRGSDRAVAINSTGDYVVVWSSLNQDGNGWGVYGQRYDRFGDTVGTEFLVNNVTQDDQIFAEVALLDDGSFVVVWEDRQGNDAVFFRLFDSAGNPVGNHKQANTTTAGDQSNPSIAMDGSGNFVIVWEGNGPGDSEGIFAQRFDAAGNNLGGEILVNTSTGNAQKDAAVSRNANGDFVVTWDDNNGFHARRFNTFGTPLGSQITMDSDISAGNGSVAIAEDGSFVATWRADVPLFGKGIYVRQYDASGNPLGSQTLVNTTVSGDQTNPSISLAPTGNFVIVWEGNGSGDGNGVFGQKFAANGNRIGSEFRINQTTGGDQIQASIALKNLNNFVVVWSGTGPGDTNGVFARQFGTASPNTAPTNISLSNSTVPENTNTSSGISVGSLTTTDPNSGDAFTYIIQGGTDALKFSIGGAGNDQLILTDGVLDFETKPSYQVLVRVTDSASNTFDKLFTINITDQNEAPTANDSVFGIVENLPAPGVVGTVTQTDPDSGDSFTYFIQSGNTNGAFSLNGSTGEIRVANSAALDLETNPVFTLIINVQDAGGLSDTATITINLTDENEAPVLTDANFNLLENSPNSTNVGTIIANDPDLGDTLTYSIQSGNTNGAFSINATTGVLTVNNSASLDLETNPVFTLIINVQDTQGLSDTATITINLTDENEAPVLTDAAFSINENLALGSRVGTVIASDPDMGDSLTYSIQSGNADGAFSINPTTGELRVANSSALDFEQRPEIPLIIEVLDSQGASDTGTITVTLQDVSEPPIAVNDQFFAFTRQVVLNQNSFIQNDIHPEGELLTVTGFADVSDGELTDAGNQTFLFIVPENLTNGTITFTYFVEDESGRIASAQATLIVTLPQPPPLPEPPPNPDPVPEPILLAAAPLSSQESESQSETETNTAARESARPGDVETEFARTPIPSTNRSEEEEGATFLPLRESEEETEIVKPVEEAILDIRDEPVLEQRAMENRERMGKSSREDSAQSSERASVLPVSQQSALQHASQIVLKEIGEGSIVWQDLDQMDEDLQADADFQSIVVGTAVTVSSTLTVGYVLWMIRGGMLVGSLLAQMPAWRLIDPLPILDHLNDLDDADEESLESIIEDSSNSPNSV